MDDLWQQHLVKTVAIFQPSVVDNAIDQWQKKNGKWY